MTAVAALTERILRGELREDLPFAVLAPAGNFVVFNYAFRNVIDTGDMSYPQYLLPAIIIQVVFFGALTTVDRTARDESSEFGVRLRTLPVPVLVPMLARMVYCLIRGALALIAGIAVGYLFGFRMSGGLVDALSFVALVLLLTIALSLGADAIGARVAGGDIGKSGAPSQLLLAPQTLFIMLSTGMAPIDSFPDWIQPFVSYQPVSVVTETLRGFSTGHIATTNLMASLAWCAGLLAVFGALAVRMQRRA